MALALFWAAVALIFYHHFGYPLLLRQLARRRRLTRPLGSPATLPSVTVVVPAHNEARCIEAKLENLCALVYPATKLNVVLALDGCSDETELLARDALTRLRPAFNFQIVVGDRQLGKIAVLNARIAEAASDIVALSDASAVVPSDALLRAADWFADPGIGVVCGAYDIAGAGQEGERAYWRYQSRIKEFEAALAGPVGAHGAFYLFRRTLWTPLPADTVNDDFVLPMQIVLKGYTAAYEPAIVAVEMESASRRQEFLRRVRIGTGNVQQIARLAALFDPRKGSLAFVFFSGKGLRAAMPVLLGSAGGAALALAFSGSPAFACISVLGLCIFALGAVEGTRFAGVLPRPLRWVGYAAQGHLALALGTLIYLAGFEHRAWRLARRSGSHPTTQLP